MGRDLDHSRDKITQVTVDQAVPMLGKSHSTIMRMIRDGRLPARKVEAKGHRRWIIDLSRYPGHVQGYVQGGYPGATRVVNPPRILICPHCGNPYWETPRG
jgi:predicted DNA-binding transcriptional regulator AlpA